MACNVASNWFDVVNIGGGGGGGGFGMAFVVVVNDDVVLIIWLVDGVVMLIA